MDLKILKSVIAAMDAAVQPYEIGGILGMRKGDVIDEVAMDVISSIPVRQCSYTPNVNYLNQVLEQWQKNEIIFRGIFHIHFAGVRTLSEGDRKYIEAIMQAMPEDIDYLYFPIFVLPKRELVCYKAVFINGCIDIRDEKVTIVDCQSL